MRLGDGVSLCAVIGLMVVTCPFGVAATASEGPGGALAHGGPRERVDQRQVNGRISHSLLPTDTEGKAFRPAEAAEDGPGA